MTFLKANQITHKNLLHINKVSIQSSIQNKSQSINENNGIFQFVLMTLFVTIALSGCSKNPDPESADDKTTQKGAPVLTVTTATLSTTKVTDSIETSGNVAAWQEASIGAEVPGLRITSVRAQVGDWVNKGQLLATFETSSVAAQTAEIDASIAEAQVNLKEAQLNAARFNELKGTGAVSEYQISQAQTGADAAAKRLEALKASKQAQNVRDKNTRVLAPSSGVISARNATIGTVAGTGTELFRLILDGRLEWQGEVDSEQLAKLKVGMPVTVTSASGFTVPTHITRLAPSINTQTRKALVFADLPVSAKSTNFAAGMYLKGRIALDEHEADVLPKQAVVLRDGFHTVFVVNSEGAVAATRVTIGATLEDKVEILNGVNTDQQVVVEGAGFLNQGDVVNVVNLAQTQESNTENATLSNKISNNTIPKERR